MKKLLLFEIPVYSMTKQAFDAKWEEINESRFLALRGFSEDEIKDYSYLLDYPRNQWKYNQIIGYIAIYVSAQDVWFDIYLSSDKRYYANSNTKHFIQNILANGTHFRVSENDDNEMIRKKIREQLKSIKTNHLRRGFYIDYELFNNIFPYVDIREIMNTLDIDL